MVRNHSQYSCEVCRRRYSRESAARMCESKKPYPPDFAIGDECIVILNDGHKDNAYIVKITGMKLKGHHHVRLVEIVKQYSNPYKHEYELNENYMRMMQ